MRAVPTPSRRVATSISSCVTYSSAMGGFLPGPGGLAGVHHVVAGRDGGLRHAGHHLPRGLLRLDVRDLDRRDVVGAAREGVAEAFLHAVLGAEADHDDVLRVVRGENLAGERRL